MATKRKKKAVTPKSFTDELKKQLASDVDSSTIAFVTVIGVLILGFWMAHSNQCSFQAPKRIQTTSRPMPYSSSPVKHHGGGCIHTSS